MFSVRHTAAKKVPGPPSRCIFCLVCLVWPWDSIYLLLEYGHIARPPPEWTDQCLSKDVSRVNIAQITIAYLTPCTTSNHARCNDDRLTTRTLHRI
jgi:hypothetical protein